MALTAKDLHHERKFTGIFSDSLAKIIKPNLFIGEKQDNSTTF
jgi:hypothetical protein